MAAVGSEAAARLDASAQPPLSAAPVLGAKPDDGGKGSFMLHDGYRTTSQAKLKLSISSRSSTPGIAEHQDNVGDNPEGGKNDYYTQVFALPPVDEGFGAWGYVVAAFCMFVVVWGFPQAFPIFQTHLQNTYQDSSVLTLLAPGLQGIIQGVLFRVLPKAPRYRQLTVIIAISIIVLAMLLASCATEPWHVVLTQGCLFGVGAVLLNYVHVSIFPEWFDKKKGRAMGIIWLGWRVGGLGLPLISQWLLDKHGYHQTMIVLVAPMIALLVPAVLLFRGRYAAAAVTVEPQQTFIGTMKVLQDPDLIFHLAVAMLHEAVTNVPTMFMMQYGADLGLSTSDQALSLSLRVLGMMVGTFVLSWLSDFMPFEVLMASSAVSTSLVHFVIWGFARGQFTFYAYAIAVGLTSGGYYNCVVSYFSRLSGSDSEMFRAIHGLFSFCTGITILSVGPIGLAILRHSPRIDQNAYAIGKYQYLLCYAGGMTMASGLLTLIRVAARRANMNRAQA